MKKLKIFSLLFVVLLALGSAVPVFAVEENELVASPEVNINDSLVSWWNFEGENAADMLKDKATKGESTDDLTKKGSGTVIENGVAYIPSAYENHLDLTAATKDMTNVTSMTIYMKAKYSGENTDFADLITYNGLYRIYKLKDSTSPNGAVMEASAFATKNNSKLGTVRIRPKSEESVKIVQDEWFYIALTMEIDADNKGTAIMYISKDGLTYYKTVTNIAFTDAVIDDMKVRQEDTKALVTIGKMIGSNDISDRGISYWFDDIRIYNTVLTEKELARIIPNSLELRAESDIPDTPNPPDDNGSGTPPTTKPDNTPSTKPGTSTKPADTAPTTTKPVETEAVTDGSSSQTEKSGCGSVMSTGLAVTVAAVVLGCGTFWKRRKKTVKENHSGERK